MLPAKGKFFMLYGTGTLHLKVIQIQCVYNVMYVTSMPFHISIYICRQEQKIVIFVTQNKMLAKRKSKKIYILAKMEHKIREYY